METDYISREAAVKKFTDRLPNISEEYIYKIAEEIPAADVRPVVYCRDCIYDGNCFAQSILEEMSRIPFDKNKFFCADGKRRDGGTP